MRLPRQTSILYRFIKRPRIRFTVTIMILGLWTLSLQTATAQNGLNNITKAAIDSAILYERLKPVHAKLETAYSAQREYTNFLLRRTQEQKLLLDSYDARAKVREKELEAYAKKRFWKGLKTGFVTGAGTSTILLIVLIL